MDTPKLALPDGCLNPLSAGAPGSQDSGAFLFCPQIPRGAQKIPRGAQTKQTKGFGAEPLLFSLRAQ